VAADAIARIACRPNQNELFAPTISAQGLFGNGLVLQFLACRKILLRHQLAVAAQALHVMNPGLGLQ